MAVLSSDTKPYRCFSVCTSTTNNANKTHRNLVYKFVLSAALNNAEVCLGHRILHIDGFQEMLKDSQSFQGT